MHKMQCGIDKVGNIDVVVIENGTATASPAYCETIERNAACSPPVRGQTPEPPRSGNLLHIQRPIIRECAAPTQLAGIIKSTTERRAVFIESADQDEPQ